MDELISRQDAIDEIRKCRFVVDALEKIRGLPSADRPQGEWIPMPVSRDGVFIPNITVEMLRNAPLEGVEDLLASGEMKDISLPYVQSDIIRCKECKYRGETEDGEYNPEDIVCAYWMSDGLSETDYCSYAERRTDEVD